MTAITASFSVDVDIGNLPLTVTFTDTSTGGPADTWSWDFGEGEYSDTPNTATHTYTEPGIYNAILTVWSGVDADASDATPIDVNYEPVASFTKSLGSDKLTVTFTDTSTHTPTSWDWDFGDGTAHGTTQNPVHTYAEYGLYTIILIATNDYGEDTITKTFYVGPLILSANVQDGMTEFMARATIQFNEFWEPQDGDRTIAVEMKDHTGTDQTVFYGVIPKPKYTQNPASALEQATHNAFSMMYYLSRQHPANQGIRSNATYDEATGAWTYQDPAALVLLAIGGSSGWSVKTNLYPKDLDVPASWPGADDPAQKVFECDTETTWADYLSQIADHYQMLLIAALDPTQTPCRTDLYFIPNDQIDTLYPVPAQVDFTYGQKWGPIDNLITDLSPADEVNTVTIWGYKNTATERITGNTDPVTITLHESAVAGSVVGLVDGEEITTLTEVATGVLRVNYDTGTVAFNTGHVLTGPSGSGTIWVKYGNWEYGGYQGYLLLTDVTGTFADNDAITDNGSPAGSALVNGTPANSPSINSVTITGLGGSDILYLYYTPFESFYKSIYPNVGEYHALGAYNPVTNYAPNDVVTYLGSSYVCIQNATGVTPAAGAYWNLYFKPLECPIEKITIPDDVTIDPQTYVDTYCYDKYTLLSADAHIYRATFDQRCDLRKYQIISFTGWTTVPSTDMRITNITYDMDGNGFVKVTVDCVSDRVFLNKAYMKRLQSSKPINVIQSMIDASTAKLDKEQLGVVVTVTGDSAIAKTPDGTYYNKPAV